MHSATAACAATASNLIIQPIHQDIPQPMSPPHHFAALDQLTQVFAPQLNLIRRALTTHLATEEPLITEAVDSLLSAQSKYVRPLLSLICSELVDDSTDQPILLGVISEYIHMASLLHDDVVDHTAIRRGQSTCREQFGNARAVLVGDYIYARACELIATTGSVAVLKLYAEAIRLMSAGEVMQLAALNAAQASCTPMDLSRYQRIIRAKTGALMAATAAAPYELKIMCSSNISHHTATTVSLYDYGMNLGMAYQVVDDVLDYSITTQSTKPPWQDFKEGKLTLPMYYCLKGFNDTERRFFQQTFFNTTRRLEAQSWYAAQLRKHQALQHSLVYATKLTHRATAALDRGFDSSHQPVKHLRDLATDLISRLS